MGIRNMYYLYSKCNDINILGDYESGCRSAYYSIYHKIKCIAGWAVYANRLLEDIQDLKIRSIIEKRISLILEYNKGLDLSQYHINDTSGNGMVTYFSYENSLKIDEIDVDGFVNTFFKRLDDLACEDGLDNSDKEKENMNIAFNDINRILGYPGTSIKRLTYIMLGGQIYTKILIDGILKNIIDITDIKPVEKYIEKINYRTKLETYNSGKELEFNSMLQREVYDKARRGAIDSLKLNYNKYKMQYIEYLKQQALPYITIITEYINRNDRKVSFTSFLEKKGLDYKEFSKIREKLVSNGLFIEEFEILEQEFKNNQSIRVAILENKVTNIVKSIQDGMDYYEYACNNKLSISELENLINKLKIELTPTEVRQVKSWIKSNKSKDAPVNYKVQMEMVYKSLDGEILYSNEMKQLVFDYMSKNRLPHTIGVFKYLLKRLKDTGSLDG